MNQFSAVRFIEELPGASTAAEEEAGDEDDFVEVPPLSLPSNHQTTSNAEVAEEKEIETKEKVQISVKPLAFLTDKLPWEMKGRPSSSLSKQLQNSLRSGPARPSGRSRWFESRFFIPVHAYFFFKEAAAGTATRDTTRINHPSQ